MAVRASVAETFEELEHRGAAFGGEAVEVILVVVGEEGIAHGLEGQLHFVGLRIEEFPGFACVRYLGEGDPRIDHEIQHALIVRVLGAPVAYLGENRAEAFSVGETENTKPLPTKTLAG